MKNFLISLTLLFASSVMIDAQAGCDTAPQLGMLIGRCDEYATPEVTWYTCTPTHDYGTVCFFWGGPS